MNTGGFYDHVAPPATVSSGDIVIDKDNNHHNFSFTQLGVRVPAIVISPLIPRNMIDHTIYDHTSLLATVEALFGLKPLTKRDAAAQSLTRLISLNIPRIDAPLTLPEPAVSGFHCNDDQSPNQTTPNTQFDNTRPIHQSTMVGLPPRSPAQSIGNGR